MGQSYLLIKTGFQVYSLVVNSTELIHKLYLFRYLMSQVNMTWRNYNSYAIFYITWLRESYYVFTAQLKFKVHIYKISQSR